MLNTVRLLLLASVLLASPAHTQTLGMTPSGGETVGSTLSNGVVAFWKLEEASGTRSDEVGSNDLTDNNTVTQATGIVGNAAQFTNANSEHLSIADNTDLSTGDIDFTLTGWIYLDNKSTQEGIISRWNESGSNREYLIDYLNSTDVFRFAVSSVAAAGGTGGITVVSADQHGSPSTATWIFFVCWHDATANTINIQINDGTADSTATSGGVFDGAADFELGAIDTASFLDGRIDAVGFWKRVLTTAEKTELYNSGSGLEHPF